MIDLRNGDCREVLATIPDGSVDLVVMDPPYEFGSVTGGGAFGTSNREYHGKLEPISHGLDLELLESIVSKMKAVNAYIFCNKTQLRMYLDHFEGRGCNVDVLTWHKTNPTPTCNNKYLSDTEYVVYARDPGVRLYGTYESKRKFWVTPVNREDRDRYGHPTVKPLDIVSTLVSNSSQPRAEGGLSRVKYDFKAVTKTTNYGKMGKPRETLGDMRGPSSVQHWNVETGLHPTQKPVTMCEYLIRTYTDEGDTVLDCCMGSGTTGVAAANLRRNFIGIERNPEYFEQAKARIETVYRRVSESRTLADFGEVDG